MTRKELINSILSATEPVYGTRESAAIARLVAERRYGLSRAECALDPNAVLNPGHDFARLLADLAAARPVQYILGVADFDGLELAVGEGVLIPRPETEELVRWIAEDVRKGGSKHPNDHHQKSSDGAATATSESGGLQILDIGTGSGAIAIALAKRLPEARVTAIDLSPEALKYARLNNERTGAGIEIIRTDALDPAFDPALNPGPRPVPYPTPDSASNPNPHPTSNQAPPPTLAPYTYNIIVSNPPYIPAAERAQMPANVTEYEPHSALLVPDDDSLVFYRAIAKFARRRLAADGALYFEIHEAAAANIIELLATEGFNTIELRNDINSKPRMIKCIQ